MSATLFDPLGAEEPPGSSSPDKALGRIEPLLRAFVLLVCFQRVGL
jgi:hypothetical protein